ncbi:avirulence protein 1b [Phytophthora sojae]|uniref:RxLR effector protein n=2 Tax=Phytophthora sojae TaxID=67593 RepID=G4Z7B6_PHYSP|nr:avirulence protein 1b [Phytophthora sojae]AEK80468.1 Avh9 [Phytophthora sojae]AEK80470.1 Avh9 [Phytophthora sojae]EGZ19624.1 avirulence protein 1b [Phytophthora sojae]|eukprot:XP_009522341.1 avirulence protein 1b [Phytophthora sojae]
MQLGFFLLVVVAALAASLEAVIASADMAITLLEKDSVDVARHSNTAVSAHGGRFLRAHDNGAHDPYDKSPDDERTSTWYKQAMRLIKGEPVLNRKFRSPPTADKLKRSKSLSSRNAAAPKWTRSESLPNLNAIGLEDVLQKGEKALNKDFKTMIKLKKTWSTIFISTKSL